MEEMMKYGSSKWFYLLIAVLVVVFTTACHHEMAKAQPNVPAPTPAPTAAISANPAYIERGQSSTLSWQTTNASDINIQGLGTVPATGSRTLYPAQSTTYQLVAKGAGGEGSASARVTVNSPAAAASTSGNADDGRFPNRAEDAFFDYDRFNIRPDEMPRIEADAQYLQHHQSVKVMIEGHCDERGSEEYNLALGAKRASAVQQALIQLGVSPSRLQTVSYGKERPFCSASNEQCWQQNRRDHFTERQ
jgi:peptidoglycan-associated lipoprotein